MLILEGSDCLGKTTAAKRIVELCAERAELMEDVPYDEYDDLGVDSWGFPIRYAHMTRPNVNFNFFHDYKDLISKYAVQDRFHLGGLVWHENRIDAQKLFYIENWLYSLGSYIVIFASPDEEWYKEKLETNVHKEMFDVDTIIKGNNKYLEMVSGTYPLNVRFDQQILIGPENGYPNDDDLNKMIDLWFTRINLLGRD